MDVSIRDDGGNFNYRVCAVMTDHDKILAMRDERSPFYYLPGGRVMIGETAGTGGSKKDWFAVWAYKKLPNEAGGTETTRSAAVSA